MKTAFIILIVILHVAIFKSIAQCDYVIANSQTVVDGSNGQYTPGSTICLENGSKDFLILKNIHGNAENTITITNHGGPVTFATSHYYGIKISNCSYIQLTGTGDANSAYGFQVTRVDSGAGISVTDLSTDIEIDHIEISNTSIGGVYAKSEPDCSFNSTRDKFTMYNFIMHDCYIHDVKDEGFYVGSSKYSGQTINCDGKDTTVFPHVIIGVKIYNNLVVNTGWDGIQVSSAPSNCEIYGNTVRNDSYRETLYQMSGIIIGGGSRCDCYNNQIYDGKGDGIDIFGLGFISVFNNLIVNAGRTYQPSVETAFKHGIYVGQFMTSPNATFNFFNNTIVNPKSNGIKYANDEAIKANFVNNIITNPGRLSAEGNQAYINGTQTSIQKISNFLSPDNSTVKFLGQNPNLYDLQPNSPAVNTGTNLVSEGIDFDILNRLRPFHSYFDIGAYECHDEEADLGKDGSELTFKIFPNPTNGILNITSTLPINELTLYRVYNAQGQIIDQGIPSDNITENSFTINIQHFNSGTHFIELVTKHGILRQKFTIL